MNFRFYILFFISYIFAQIPYWPYILNTPVPFVISDSNFTEIELNQNLKEGFYSTENLFILAKNDSMNKFEQTIKFELHDDHSLAFEDYNLNLSGSIVKKKYPFHFTSIGLDWSPMAVLNRNNKSSGISSIRFGPNIHLFYLDMPMYFGCGGAINLWNYDMDSIPGWKDLKNIKNDVGFYGNIHIGNNKKPLIQGIPVYAEGNIFGQYMQSENKSKFTSGKIDILFINDITFADTLFIYLADTLTKGRTALKNTSTPNRTNNSIQASIGVKNITDFNFKPSLSYTWSLSSITFPPYENILGDEQLIKNTFIGNIHNDNSKFIDYTGAISLTFEKDDFLFRNKFPDTTSNNNPLKDSLTINLLDYYGFLAKMYHSIEKKFKKSIGFFYSFKIDRYKIIYPNFYILNAEEKKAYRSADTEIREYGDKDNVFFKHILDLTLISTPKILFTAYSEFSRNKSVFLRKEKSFLNKNLRIIRMETSIAINPDKPTSMKETLGIRVKVEEFHFPKFDKVNFPTHSRKFYSKFLSTWEINDFLVFEGSWDEIYFDEGYRYPQWKYENTNNIVEKVDAYGPYYISIESSLKLKLSLTLFNKIILEAGSLFRYIHYYNWNYNQSRRFSRYKPSENYNLLPFFEMKAYIFNNLSLQCRFQRYIDSDINSYSEANSFLSARF